MFTSDPRRLIARAHSRLTDKRYIIRRTNTPKQRFYVRTLWDYKWTGNPAKATVFHDIDDVRNEVMATRVWYECMFVIEDAPPKP